MNQFKLSIKSEIFSLSILALSIAASFYFYAHFPERVITHWGFNGEPNGWSGRSFAAFFMPVLLVGMYAMFLAIPWLDPRKERYVEFAKVYDVFRNVILSVLAFIYFIASLSNLGFKIDVGAWIPAVIGILFIVLGNYLGKIKRNWFVGIRTPWTMSSETVWNRTHRFGGKVFMIAGLIMALTVLVPMAWRLPLFIADIIVILIGTIGYSYYAYLQEKKK
jgi:uncharacterized membrane protein